MAKNLSVTASLSAADTFTNWIEVQGPDFVIEVTGAFVGSLQLQYEVQPAESDVWETTGDDAITTAGKFNVLNPIMSRYRVGFPAGSYTSGTADVTIRSDNAKQVQV